MHDSFEKGIKLSASFSPGLKAPLDSRTVVQDIAERDALVTGNIAFEGLICYVIDEKKHYKLIDLVNATWEVFGSGTGGDLSDYQKKTDDTLTTTDQTVVGGINELDAEIGNPVIPEHYELDNVSGTLTVVSNGTLTNPLTEVEEKDVLGIATVGEKVNLIPEVQATGLYKKFEDYQTKNDNTLTTTNQTIVGGINELDGEIGDITQLGTNDKTDIVTSINEINTNLGDISTLKTSNQSSTVEAINELFNDKVNSADVVDNLTSTDTDKPLSANQGKVLRDEVGTLTNLATDDQTSLVDAVNEVDGNIGNLTNLQTSVQTSLVDAVNEVDGNIGDLTQLKTNVQTSLTSSVNEVVDNIGEKREFTPAHYELDNINGTFTVVSDDKVDFNELTEVKVTDANKNNDGIPFITGNKVNFVDEQTTKPASGLYDYIDSKVGNMDFSTLQAKKDDTLETTDKTIVGAINELVDMLVIPPTYTEPTLKITTNPATLKQEVGTTITPVLSYTFTQNDAGAELSHSYSPLDNTTQAQLTIVEGDNIEYSVTVNYDEGVKKNDNFGKPNGTPIQAGSITSKVKYVGVRNMFYGVNTVANTYTDSTAVRALTAKEIGATKITVPVGSKQIVIAIPSTKTISSILYQEQGNANYLGNFTKTTVQVSGATAGADLINYDVYTYNLAIANASIMTFNVTIA